MASVAAALEAVKAEARDAVAELDSERTLRAEAEGRSQRAEEQLKAATAKAGSLKAELEQVRRLTKHAPSGAWRPGCCRCHAPCGGRGMAIEGSAQAEQRGTPLDL
jgi:hypothetical protein